MLLLVAGKLLPLLLPLLLLAAGNNPTVWRTVGDKKEACSLAFGSSPASLSGSDMLNVLLLGQQRCNRPYRFPYRVLFGKGLPAILLNDVDCLSSRQTPN